MFSTKEVSRLLGVSYWRIQYAFDSGAVPEPQKLGHSRVYTPEDIDRLRNHFAQKGKKEEK